MEYLYDMQVQLLPSIALGWTTTALQGSCPPALGILNLLTTVDVRNNSLSCSAGRRVMEQCQQHQHSQPATVQRTAATAMLLRHQQFVPSKAGQQHDGVPKHLQEAI